MEEKRQFTDKFMLRLPDGMRDQIKAEAETNNRSMNAEIIARLDASLADDWQGLPSDLMNRITEFESTMRSEFRRLNNHLDSERLMRAKAEDSLIKERLKD